MRTVVRFLLWTAALVGALIAVARLTAIRWWRVPLDDPVLAASVAPTLQGGDLIVLWRLTPPTFGDLVLCPDPDDPAQNIVARIAAEPGDQISVQGDRIALNGKTSGTERSCRPDTFEVEHPHTHELVEQTCQIEALRGASHQRGSIPKDLPTPRGDSREVPDDMVYLVSDNRAFPFDSRDYGAVERGSCTETVIFRLVSKAGYFDGERRFTLIQ